MIKIKRGAKTQVDFSRGIGKVSPFPLVHVGAHTHGALLPHHHFNFEVLPRTWAGGLHSPVTHSLRAATPWGSSTHFHTKCSSIVLHTMGWLCLKDASDTLPMSTNKATNSLDHSSHTQDDEVRVWRDTRVCLRLRGVCTENWGCQRPFHARRRPSFIVGSLKLAVAQLGPTSRWDRRARPSGRRSRPSGLAVGPCPAATGASVGSTGASVGLAVGRVPTPQRIVPESVATDSSGS